MRLTLLLAGTALVLTACGGGSTPTASTSTPASATSTPAATAATPATSAPAAAATPMTSAQLRQQLLTIDDLPPGYSADKLTPSDSTDKGGHTFCNYPATPARTVARQTFTNAQGMATSLFQVGIRRYASDAQAAAQMKLLKTALQTCHGETYEGEKVTYSLISSPDLGREHVGVRIEYKQGANTEYFILLGPDLLQVAMGGTALSTQTINELTDLANKQVTKVQNG